MPRRAPQPSCTAFGMPFPNGKQNGRVDRSEREADRVFAESVEDLADQKREQVGERSRQTDAQHAGVQNEDEQQIKADLGDRHDDRRDQRRGGRVFHLQKRQHGLVEQPEDQPEAKPADVFRRLRRRVAGSTEQRRERIGKQQAEQCSRRADQHGKRKAARKRAVDFFGFAASHVVAAEDLRARRDHAGDHIEHQRQRHGEADCRERFVRDELSDDDGVDQVA